MFFYKQNDDKLVATVILQVNDCIIAGSSTFLEVEEKGSEVFISKVETPLQMIPSHVNVVLLLFDLTGRSKLQNKKVKKAQDAKTDEGFKSQRLLLR